MYCAMFDFTLHEVNCQSILSFPFFYGFPDLTEEAIINAQKRFARIKTEQRSRGFGP